MAYSIRLSSQQMQNAKEEAVNLHDTLRMRGYKNAHGLRDEDATVSMEAGGAAAELACALLLNVSWTAKQNSDPRSPDIGRRTQVRSSSKYRKSHSLIIRTRDIEKYGDVPFILVIQQDDTFVIKGWIMSFEGVRIGRFWDGGDRDRPEAYFVHEDLLHPIETLKDV